MGLHTADCHGRGRRGSPCARGCRSCAQLLSLRSYRCERCAKTVAICSRCDRGQRYCAADCSVKQRRESLRRAGRRHQASRTGRRKHAARQDQYRRRQKRIVTHQGPPEDSVFVQPLGSGLSTPPEKENSDVPSRPVSVLPAAPVLSRASAAALSSPVPPSSASSPSAPGKEHVCHFCGAAQSAYLRRDSLCQLRRRLSGKARPKRRLVARSPP